MDVELRRVGTPVFNAEGWRKIPALGHTLLLLGFAPWVFARRLRVDETTGWASLVALASVLPMALAVYPWGLTYEFWLRFLPPLIGISLLFAIVQSAILAAIPVSNGSNHWTYRHRFHVWLIVSLYSLPLVLVWPLWADSWLLEFFDFCVYWPASEGEWWRRKWALLFVGWRFVILASFLFVRIRPRWIAIVALPLGWILAGNALQLADGLIPRLSR